MSDTTISTLKTLLENVLSETEDPEHRYKLRTALQLVVFLEEEHERAREALSDADLEAELREDLRDLGYLE